MARPVVEDLLDEPWLYARRYQSAALAERALIASSGADVRRAM